MDMAVLMIILQGVVWLKMAMGGDFEMCILVHLLNTLVYSFQGGNYWLVCFPHGIDRRIPADINVKSMHIFLRSSHFEVFTAVRRQLTSEIGSAN